MPGFFGFWGCGNKFQQPVGLGRQYQLHSTSFLNFYVERQTLDRFMQDKPFFENADYFLVIEGVIFNRKKLEAEFKTAEFYEAVILMYLRDGERFFSRFRGSFSGLFYDKKEDLCIIFTSHVGEKQIFYANCESRWIFGSEIRFLLNYYRHKKCNIRLDIEAAYMSLTYGFLIENHTLVEDIKRLNAGNYIKYQNGRFSVNEYHHFSNETEKLLNLDYYIDGIDYYFRNAISNQFEKDREYGLNHITTLSGGLDSRMTVIVAHEMGYTEQLNTTFSQSNYLDETIAHQIATDFNHDFIFKSLDHGSFLLKIDEITRISYGSAVYYGLAHGHSLYNVIDFNRLGIVHTGQLGDAILGTFYNKPNGKKDYVIGDGAYSTTLIERLKDYSFIYSYPNIEIFKLYTRAFTGANQGLLVFQEKTESMSPFYDVDFLSFCYSIPIELRFRHKIYFDWIFAKYPKAAEYIWERSRVKIKRIPMFETRQILGRDVEKGAILKWISGSAVRRLHPQSRSVQPAANNTGYHMNPLDYWYNNEADLRTFMELYLYTNIDFIPENTLRDDCVKLFCDGTTLEKTMVLSLVSAIKLIYS